MYFHHCPINFLTPLPFFAEPPWDLLSLMARRVFSQQDVLTRMDNEGLVSPLDAGSSLVAQQPTDDATAVAPAPKLPPIRTRPMANSF